MSLGAVIMLLIALYEHDMKSMFGAEAAGHGHHHGLGGHAAGDEHIHEAVQHGVDCKQQAGTNTGFSLLIIPGMHKV